MQRLKCGGGLVYAVRSRTLNDGFLKRFMVLFDRGLILIYVSSYAELEVRDGKREMIRTRGEDLKMLIRYIIRYIYIVLFYYIKSLYESFVLYDF